MAATRKSIMSEGATMSAPASAWLTAVLDNNSSVGSLSTSPLSTIPQCPWSVYSQRHTSVITRRESPNSRLIFRTAFCTIPASEYAPEPTASLVSGMPKRSMDLTPSFMSLSISRSRLSMLTRSMPGIELISSRLLPPSDTK